MIRTVLLRLFAFSYPANQLRFSATLTNLSRQIICIQNDEELFKIY